MAPVVASPDAVESSADTVESPVETIPDEATVDSDPLACVVDVGPEDPGSPVLDELVTPPVVLKEVVDSSIFSLEKIHDTPPVLPTATSAKS